MALSENDGSATAKSSPSDKSSPPISSSQGSQSSRQSSPREARQGETSLEPGQTTSISVHNYLVIAPNVTPNLHRQAYDRFLYDFVFPESPNRAPGEPTDALWSFVPILYQNAVEGSSITTAVDALAYINYANRCNAPQAESLAEACLAKTISSLSKAIADRKVAATNATLCSAYLLGVYEVRKLVMSLAKPDSRCRISPFSNVEVQSLPISTVPMRFYTFVLSRSITMIQYPLESTR